MSDKRYLVWTGIHTLRGCCNVSFDPPASDTGIQQRLRILGFNCGDDGDAMNAEVTAARIKLRAMLDPTLQIQGLTHHGEPSLEAPAGRNKGLELPVEGGPAFNGAMQQALDQLAYAAKGQPPPSDRNRQRQQARRLVIARRDANAEDPGGVLNTTRHIAIRVDGVPESFIPFRDLACFTLKFQNLSSVESLLVRVYRNYDRATETYHPPPTKIVYQEVLKRADIEALPKKIPGKSDKLKALDPSVSTLLRMHTNTGSEAHLAKLNAPFKVKVWISNAANAFDELIPDDPAPAAADEGADHLHRIAEAAEVENFAPPADPVRQGLELVHDELPLEVAPDDDAPPVAEDWPDLRVTDANRLTRSAKYWTDRSNDGIGKYAFNAPCDDHDRQFLNDNQIQDERFVIDEYEADVLATYRGLRDARDEHGPEFPFGQLAEVFRNVERHLNLIEMRYCCGEFCNAPDAEKADATEFVGAARLAVADIRNRQFPYRSSILLATRFIRAVTEIIARRRNIPECQVYHRAGVITRADGGTDPLTYRRSLGLGFRHCIHTDADTYFGLQQPIAAIFADDAAARRDNYLLRSLMTDDPRFIIFPSYNPLTTAFFVKIRQAPLFILGLVDATHLVADGIFQNPYGFFRHDNFHVVGTSETNEQQWQTIRRHVQDMSKVNELAVYAGWNDNGQTLVNGVEALPAGLREIAYNLLFSVLHEPLNKSETRAEYNQFVPGQNAFRADQADLDTVINKADDDTAEYKTPTMRDWIAPAVLNADNIRARLESTSFIENQIEKMRNMYFGRIFPDADINQMDAAKTEILRIIDDF